MKPSSADKPLKHSSATHCVILNLLATPGLGSLLARRFISGVGQLVLAVIGFSLIMFWFFQKMRVLYGQMFGTNLPQDLGRGFGKWGLIFFAAAWLWSLVTSIQILRSAPKTGTTLIPPKIR